MSDSDTQQLKTKALFTAGGLLFGWTLFQVLHRLAPKNFEPEKAPTQTTTAKNNSNNGSQELGKAISQFSENNELTMLKRQSLQEVTKKQSMQDQSSFSSPDEFLQRARVRLAKVNHLKDMFPDLKPLQSPIYQRASASSQERGTLATTLFAQPGTFCTQERFYSCLSELQTSLKFLRSTASTEIYCDPKETKAVIATCGGIVPGMNVVIRSLVKCLEQEYGVNAIFGAKYGFSGLAADTKDWVKLTADSLTGVQDQGGSILGVQGPVVTPEAVFERLNESKVTQVYLIGGAGTLRGAQKLRDLVRVNNAKMSIIVIPTSIDNNIPFIDRTFGFQTATQESIAFIDAANVEAEAAEFGIGIVRMPGRKCGYFPVASSLASRDVNICLAPELPFQIYGQNGVYEAMIERAKVKGHCIIVVSEGAYRGLLDSEKAQVLERNPKIERDDPKDEDSIDLALFMKSDLGKYASEKYGTKLTIKYLDPRQVVRARPANSADTDLCHSYSYVSVHSAMNGFTDFATCQVREQLVMVPLDVIVSQDTRRMKRADVEWQRLIMSTGQSNFLEKENQVLSFKKEKQQQNELNKKLIDLKLKIALEAPINEDLDEEQISVAHQRIFTKQGSSDHFGV